MEQSDLDDVSSGEKVSKKLLLSPTLTFARTCTVNPAGFTRY